jgi:hypothetical protein
MTIFGREHRRDVVPLGSGLGRSPARAVAGRSLGGRLENLATAVCRRHGSKRQTEPPVEPTDAATEEVHQCSARRRQGRLALLRSLHAECEACRGLGCEVCGGTGLA